jgi:hypothetical protein
MLKRIGMGVVLVAAVAGAGAMFVATSAFVASASPQPALSRAVPPGNKPFARICKSDEALDARPSPAWVGASFASDNCRAPGMPAAVDGLTARREQVVAGMEAQKRYAAASDSFQRCIQDFVAERKLQAKKSGQPVNNSLIVIENHRIAASESNKKIVAARVRTTIMAFNEYGSGCGG